jgi:hypothetical protein
LEKPNLNLNIPKFKVQVRKMWFRAKLNVVKCPPKKEEKRKKVCEREKCGFREEWRGEFRDSKSRQPGFKC